VLTISSEATWPRALVGEVDGREVDRYSYRPQSDYMFTLNSYPLIIIEICSREDEADHFRMLLQGAILVRAMNLMKCTGSLVTMAIYITKDFVADRYLVYQPDREEPDVRTTILQCQTIAAHFLID
jgi:hypothetical protein